MFPFIQMDLYKFILESWERRETDDEKHLKKMKGIIFKQKEERRKEQEKNYFYYVSLWSRSPCQLCFFVEYPSELACVQWSISFVIPAWKIRREKEKK